MNFESIVIKSVDSNSFANIETTWSVVYGASEPYTILFYQPFLIE